MNEIREKYFAFKKKILPLRIAKSVSGLFALNNFLLAFTFATITTLVEVNEGTSTFFSMDNTNTLIFLRYLLLISTAVYIILLIPHIILSSKLKKLKKEAKVIDEI